jgi:hypothetical protein
MICCMEFKYILIDRIKTVLFSHAIEHVDEANGRNVTSAGFCRIGVDAVGKLYVECFGRSTSLDIDSNPERDAVIIRKIAEEMFQMRMGG